MYLSFLINIPNGSIVNPPQNVAEGHVRDACPVHPRYHVRGAEVNPLLDPEIDHIVSHIRRAQRR